MGVVALTILFLVFFWICVIGAYAAVERNLYLLWADPPEEESEADRNDREQREENLALRDIQQDVFIRHFASQVGQAVSANHELLVNQGIAENRAITREDEAQGRPGDMWLCSGRPLWFAVLQLLLSLLISLPLYYGLRLPMVASIAIGLAIVTAFLGLFSFRTVEENSRLGIKRFGRQTNGYLRPGLQFVLPFGFEEDEEVPLQTLVWGLQGESLDEEATGTYHIPGVAGESNPEPGKFIVPLLGRWRMTIEVQITLRFRNKWKSAWHDALNRYRNAYELGQQIAAAANAVLFTRAREIERRVLTEWRKDPAHTTDPQEDPQASIVVFKRFQEEIPEIAGSILLSLIELGRERLGGVLIMSVAISTMTPSSELEELMQREDKIKYFRYEQMMEGKASRLRFQEIQAALEQVPDHLRETFLRLNENEVRRLFARSGEQGEPIDALIRAWLARASQRATD